MADLRSREDYLADLKKLSKTGADDEIRADLAYQLRDTLTVTGRVRRKLLWLCL